MLLIEQNYKTQDAELFAIIESLKTWCYYLKEAAHTILVFTNYNHLKKFIKITCFSSCQI